MTTELEKQFFECFGIEKRKQGYCDWDSWCPYEDLTCGNDCPYWKYSEEQYPEITAEKLLELICICSTVYPITINYKETVDELKEFILNFCIRHSKELGIKQICELFEE